MRWDVVVTLVPPGASVIGCDRPTPARGGRHPSRRRHHAMPAVPGHGGQVGDTSVSATSRSVGERNPDGAPTNGCAAATAAPHTSCARRPAGTPGRHHRGDRECVGPPGERPGVPEDRRADGTPGIDVRRWLCRTTGEHVRWLHRWGTERLVLVAREAYCNIGYSGIRSGTRCASCRRPRPADRRRFGFPDSPWDLVGINRQGCLLSPRRSC